MGKKKNFKIVKEYGKGKDFIQSVYTIETGEVEVVVNVDTSNEELVNLLTTFNMNNLILSDWQGMVQLDEDYKGKPFKVPGFFDIYYFKHVCICE